MVLEGHGVLFQGLAIVQTHQDSLIEGAGNILVEDRVKLGQDNFQLT